MSDSWWPHEPQYARPPCPSPTPRVYPNSRPLNRWGHPAISSSVVPFSSCPQTFPASGFFPVSHLFTSGGQSTEFRADRTLLNGSTKAMAPHSSTLTWKIPWTEEHGRLQSMGSLRVGHDWVTSLSLFTFLHWRRKWQLTPVLLPGESQGRGSLVGCRLWCHTESDTTEVT